MRDWTRQVEGTRFCPRLSLLGDLLLGDLPCADQEGGGEPLLPALGGVDVEVLAERRAEALPAVVDGCEAPDRRVAPGDDGVLRGERDVGLRKDEGEV